MNFSVCHSIPTSTSYNGIPLEYCAEETDNIKRRALFALLTTDLKTSSLSSNFNSGICGGRDTSIDPVDFQHWALLVHLEQGNLYLLYEASKDEATGKLRAYRADVSRELFETARKTGYGETSPQELLGKAKCLRSNEYQLLTNNCQTWLKEFLHQICSYMVLKLSILLQEMDPYSSHDPVSDFPSDVFLNKVK